MLAKPTKAIINPAYPYIATPVADFEKFKDDLRKAYPEDPVECTEYDWCFFYSKCEHVVDSLPPLRF